MAKTDTRIVVGMCPYASEFVFIRLNESLKGCSITEWAGNIISQVSVSRE